MSLTELAFWIAYVAGTGAAVFNPAAGVALYVVVYHLNPEYQWWGTGLRALGLRTSLTVAAAIAIGILVRRPRLLHGARQFPLAMILAILLGIIAAGTLVWGLGTVERSEYQAVKFAKLLVLLLILIRCIRTPTQYHAVILAWLLGVLYLGYQAQGGAGHTEVGRLTGGIGGPDFTDSSGLAVHLVATLPLVGAVFFMARTWWGRAFALVTGALAVNTIIMTRTRNVLVGLAGLAVVSVLSLPRGYRVKGLAAVVVGTLLAVQLTDPAWWQRMSTVNTYQQDPAITNRFVYWRAALQMARDYPFGIGLGNFHYKVMEYVPGLTITRSAHNTLLTCLAELGWLGLLLFLGVLGVTLTRLTQVRRMALELPEHAQIRFYRWTTRFHLGWHATALRMALVGYLGCALFTTRLFAEDLWLLLGLAACLHNVAKHQAGEREHATAPERAPAPLLNAPLPVALPALESSQG
jgi:O-antigen ligase